MAESRRQVGIVRLNLGSIEPYTPFAIGAAFCLLCLFLARALNIWQDEAYSLHTTAHGVLEAWRQGVAFEAQAPFYFALLALWRSLNLSVMHARLLSILFSLVTLYVTWDFARRYLRISPSIVLAAIAFNPFTVWAAVEIRPYAATITFSATLLLLFFRGFVDRKPKLAARVAFVAIAIIATYTQYYVASLVPACGVALLALRRMRTLRGYLVCALAIGVSFVPLVFILPQQFHAYGAFATAFKIPGYVMATVLAEYPFPHDWIGTWKGMFGLNTVYWVLLSIPVGSLIVSARTASETTKALLAIVAILFAFYTGLIAVAHVEVLIPRHTLIILMPLIALVFAVLGDVAPLRRRVPLISYLVVFTAFSLLTYWHTYRNLSKTGDWRRVAAFVHAEARPSDAIAVFNAEAELPFRFYFHGGNPITPIPRPQSFSAFDEERFVLHGEGDVAASLGQLAKQNGHVWLIESNVCERQSTFFGCSYLDLYVGTHFRVLHTTVFDGSKVLELEAPLTASVWERP